jgi:hypothetical protein
MREIYQESKMASSITKREKILASYGLNYLEVLLEFILGVS